MRTAALAIVILSLTAEGALSQAQRPNTANPPAAAPPAASPPAGSAARPQISVQPPQGAATEPRPPQLARTEVAYFDSWQTNCQEFVNPARRQCSAILQLVQTNPQTNSATILINWVVSAADDQLTATLQTPTGVSIQQGIEVRLGRTIKKLPFARCDAQRCEGVFPIDDALSRAMASAETAEVVITASQGNAVTFSIPMRGYDRAAQALRR